MKENRICKYCGAKFVPKRKDSKYCSRTCQIKGYHANRPKGKETNCLLCGRTFFAERKGIKYCSDVCRIEARDIQNKMAAKKRRTEKQTVKCLHCKAEFTPRDRRQIFCCEQCRYEYRYKNTPPKPPSKKEEKKYKPRVCAICGNTFIPNTGQQKYCGKSCAKEATRRRNLKYESEERKDFQSAVLKSKPQRQNISPASKRFAKMSLKELSLECAKYHISYGKASLMAQNNTLPEDFGLKRKGIHNE